MDKQDLLLEIGCEELPAHAIRSLPNELHTRLWGLLHLYKLETGQTRVFATPRRIAVYIKNVSTDQATEIIERSGPSYYQAFDANGQPTRSAIGFAKSCGVDVSALTEKNNLLYYKGEKPGQKAIAILPEIIKLAISQLNIAKPMRWGVHSESFARPVHWVLALFGKTTIPVTLFNIQSSNQTRGHRFHHPESLTITSPQEYENELKKTGKVIANFQDRLERIKAAIGKATPSGQRVDLDEDLLQEVTALVEWPVALMGRFNPDFLAVPQEALMTSMKSNQKYFPVLDKQGKLQPSFILISNIENDKPQSIICGNERVLNARLSDAAFFFQNDQATTLASRLPHLEHVLFQQQLGSLADKTERMVTLVDFIAAEWEKDAHIAKQAAQLCKCDLLSEMVGEFPTLQGIMGYYYAKNDGFSEECATAIKEHYYPRFSGDQLPATLPGQMIALADRVDTLVGIFGVNQAPSGDKDPFALRRAALGVLRILIEGKLSLDLKKLLERACAAYHHCLTNKQAVQQTFDFMINRLSAWYVEAGFSIKQIEAVLASGTTDPLDFDRRVRAVEQFQALPEAAALAAANKRVSNILKKQAGKHWPDTIDTRLFENNAERELEKALTTQTTIVSQLYAAAHYQDALSQLAVLKEPIDAFFDQVMVMVEDPAKRDNRLALLAALRRLLTQVADISLL